MNEQRYVNQEVEKQKWDSLRKRYQDSLEMRPMVENNSDKNESWYARGPFHYLISKQGILSDPVTTSHEIIMAAKQKPMIILILGKPRSGKTWTAKDLCQSLDLIHITVDWWIAALEKKIAEHEPPQDLEEGQQEPKWLTDFEESVHLAIREGWGPND